MSEENNKFNIKSFKEQIGGTFARPTLFQLEIEGYPGGVMRVQQVVLEDDLIESFKIYEIEDGSSLNMLNALKDKCDQPGSKYRRSHPADFPSEPQEPKTGFEVLLSRFRRDGTGYVVQRYKLNEITFGTKLDWDDANKILCHDVYVGHCEKVS